MSSDLMRNTVRHNRKKKLLLINWLKKRCSYSEDIFKDPGYSDYYKNEFNIIDGIDNTYFYNSNDIDHEINIGYDDDDNDNDDFYNFGEFIDYVDPIKISEDDIRYTNIVILPGTNQSNANFLYKIIKKYIDNAKLRYNIPIISNDLTEKYESEYKSASIQINKESFYNYLRQYSIK